MIGHSNVLVARILPQLLGPLDNTAPTGSIARVCHRASTSATKAAGRYDIFVNTSGGGMAGQAGAMKLGLARALKKIEPALESILRAQGLLEWMELCQQLGLDPFARFVSGPEIVAERFDHVIGGDTEVGGTAFEHAEDRSQDSLWCFTTWVTGFFSECGRRIETVDHVQAHEHSD